MPRGIVLGALRGGVAAQQRGMSLPLACASLRLRFITAQARGSLSPEQPRMNDDTGVVLWSPSPNHEKYGVGLPNYPGIVTYFLFNPVTGFVKIERTRGSTGLKERISLVTTMSGVKIEVLGLLEGDHERSWHRRFHKNRALGEWFDVMSGPGNGLYKAIRATFKAQVRNTETSRRVTRISETSLPATP